MKLGSSHFWQLTRSINPDAWCVASLERCSLDELEALARLLGIAGKPLGAN